MFGWLLLAVGIGGFGWAGYSDLKTTEFRDEIPYAIIVLSLVIRGAFAVANNDVNIFLNSLIYGVGFLGFGLLLYQLNQWGDGDAWLLGAMGFLFPDAAGFRSAMLMPFPVVLIFNFFLVSFVYLIVYSIGVGIHAGAGKKFCRELKGQAHNIITITLGFTIVIFVFLAILLRNPIFTLQTDVLWPLMVSPLLLLSMLVFIRYGKFIESNVFRRKVPVSKLRLGDVPVNQKWKVMTASELKKLKAYGGSVWIKEGVRFAPVFVFTILLTLFYGSVI